nr:immunoglobulin heavy chain junction region [Macaca mulatta]MOY21943.1 immunoglobulin heavy chain junction region [Macaca mulatta]MOY23262.1 immunoglobulin heavy chain junction region [Macaca mulatta]MOY23905.1 immunoglobulin heavy chain junction region [Macaca mulatta]MOY24935.1 immunoglobulin heavy chain junction region [Macaca mulatta]
CSTVNRYSGYRDW